MFSKPRNAEIFSALSTKRVADFPSGRRSVFPREREIFREHANARARARARLAAAAAQMETENPVENGRRGEEWKTGHEWGLIKRCGRESTSVKWPSVEKGSDARTNTHMHAHVATLIDLQERMRSLIQLINALRKEKRDLKTDETVEK